MRSRGARARHVALRHRRRPLHRRRARARSARRPDDRDHKRGLPAVDRAAVARAERSCGWWRSAVNVGVGTALIAFSLGPIVHFALAASTCRSRHRSRCTANDAEGHGGVARGSVRGSLRPRSPDTGLRGRAVVSALRRAWHCRRVSDARVAELVSVHSPPFLHDRHVRLALEAGVPAVMCDKPLTTVVEQSEALYEAAQAAGAHHLINFEFRCDPGVPAAAGSIAEGASVGAWSGCRGPMVERLVRPAPPLRMAVRRGARRRLDAARGRRTRSTRCGGCSTTRSRVVTAALQTVIPGAPGDDGAPHRCTAEDAFTASLRTCRGVDIALDATFVATASFAAAHPCRR